MQLYPSNRGRHVFKAELEMAEISQIEISSINIKKLSEQKYDNTDHFNHRSSGRDHFV